MKPTKSATRVVLLLLMVIVVDQLSKYLVLKYSIFPVFYNKTIAFSLPIPWYLPWVVISAVAVYLYFFSPKSFSLINEYYWVFDDRYLRIALPLIAGGGISNIIDRLFHNGTVVDFIDLRYWPVFNLADSAIVLGVGLIFYHLYTTRGAPYGKS